MLQILDQRVYSAAFLIPPSQQVLPQIEYAPNATGHVQIRLYVIWC